MHRFTRRTLLCLVIAAAALWAVVPVSVLIGIAVMDGSALALVGAASYLRRAGRSRPAS